MTTLRSISIEGFRGFCRRADFEIGETATILGGSNGTGKTSFFDALTWALFQRVPRLGGTRDYVGVDVIRNRFCDSTVPTRVSAVFSNGKSTLEIQRDHSEFKALVAGKEVSLKEVYERIGLCPGDAALNFFGAHMLSQDHIAEFVMNKPRERYDLLKNLSGIVTVETTEVFLKTISSARDEAMKIKEQLARQLQTLESSQVAIQKDIDTLSASPGQLGFQEADLESAEAALISEIKASGILAQTIRDLNISFIAPALATEESKLEAHQTVLLRMSEVLNEVSQQRTDLVQFETEYKRIEENRLAGSRNLQDLHNQLHLAEQSAEQSVASVEALRRRHSELHVLLERMATMLVEDRCPVCKRPIEIDSLRQIISDELSLGPSIPNELLASAQIAAKSVDDIRRAIAQVQADERNQQEQLNKLRNQIEFCRQHLSFFDSQAAKVAPLFSHGSTISQDMIGEVRTRLGERLRAIKGWVMRIRETNSRRSMLSQISLLSDKQKIMINLAAQRSGIASKHYKASQLHETLGAAWEAARNAQVEMTGKILQTYAPLIADLYRRLRPHKVFTEFGMQVTPAYKEGEVFFEASTLDGVQVRIPTVFSMAQRNSFALCVFLALNLSLGQDRRPAFVDDPIHSLDDINILALTDLLSNLKQERQFIFSTHDKRVFDLLVDRLRGVSETDGITAYWFETWDRFGPHIRKVSPPLKSSHPSAEEIAKALAAA